jgi:hypothetical protein
MALSIWVWAFVLIFNDGSIERVEFPTQDKCQIARVNLDEFMKTQEIPVIVSPCIRMHVPAPSLSS